MLVPNHARMLVLFLAALPACKEATPQVTLPDIQGYFLYCGTPEPGDDSGPPFPTEPMNDEWVAASHDFILGTIVSATVVFEPIVRYDPDVASNAVLADLWECPVPSPMVDVVLEDVRTLKGRETGQRVVIRLGSDTWRNWGIWPIDWASGGEIEEWYPSPQLVTGMRIGGAIYEHSWTPGWLVMSGNEEPMLTMVDGQTQFQYLQPPRCNSMPDTTSELFNGLTESELFERLAEVAQVGAQSDRLALYEQWLDLTPDPPHHGTAGTYAARCEWY